MRENASSMSQILPDRQTCMTLNKHRYSSEGEWRACVTCHPEGEDRWDLSVRLIEDLAEIQHRIGQVLVIGPPLPYRFAMRFSNCFNAVGFSGSQDAVIAHLQAEIRKITTKASESKRGKVKEAMVTLQNERAVLAS